MDVTALLIVLMTGPNGDGMIQALAEYKSMEQCKAAAEILKREREGLNGGYHCFPLAKDGRVSIGSSWFD